MKIAITGDLFLQYSEQITISDHLKILMSGCDYRIVNLEGPLVTSDINYTPLKSGPRLKQSENVVRVLEEMGSNMLTLANNHILDYGIDGYQQTINTLHGRYLLTGCGTWEEAYKMAVIEMDGLKVGILNFCEMQFGMLHDRWSQSGGQIGCAWINHPSVDGVIINNKAKVDKLIAICHCGLEMVDVPLPEWRDRYRQLIDLGCDAVIAHHPHVVQGTEIYKNAPICYSLGNFCFVGSESIDDDSWRTGALAMLDISKESVFLKTYGVRINNEKCLTIVPDNEWNLYSSSLNNKLESPDYITNVNNICISKYDLYRTVFAMGGLFPADRYWLKHIARIILHRYNYVHTLNNLQCESHRWCICRGIRLIQPEIS